MTSKTKKIVTTNNTKVAGISRHETEESIEAFLNAQDAMTTKTEETTAMTTNTTTPFVTLTPKAGNYPANLNIFGVYAPTVYSFGNLDLLKASNRITVIGSTHMSPQIVKLTKNAMSLLSEKAECTFILGNAIGTDLDTQDAQGKNRPGLLSHVLHETTANAILVMATGISPELAHALTPYQDRILILSLIDPEELMQSGNLKIAKRRVAMVAALASTALVMQTGPEKSGSWNSVMQSLNLGQDVFVLNVEQMEYNQDLIEFWGCKPLPKRDEWIGTIITNR